MTTRRRTARPRLDVASLVAIAAIAGLAATHADRPHLVLPMAAATFVGVDVARVDLATRRIPNRRVGLLVAIALAGAVLGGLAGSPSWSFVLGAMVGGGPVLLFHLVSPAGMGFGDVKWAAALGAVVGLEAWSLAVLVPLAGSLLAIGAAAVTRQRHIAFAPSLSLGALLAVTLGPLLMAGLR